MAYIYSGTSSAPPSTGDIHARALQEVASLPRGQYEPKHLTKEKRELDTVLLAQAARERSLQVERFGRFTQLIHKDGRGLVFHKNMTSRLLYRDRAATNRKHVTKWILEAAELPTVPGVLAEDADAVTSAFEELGGPVVVKPVMGSGGAGVYVGALSSEEAVRAATPIFDSGHSVLVEDQFLGLDLRVSVIGGKAVAASLRVPARVVGDGRSTVSELVQMKNSDRRRNDYLRHQPLVLNPTALALLNESGVRPDSVLADGEQVFLSRVANISQGGESFEVGPLLHPSIIELAERATALFPSTVHAGIDIFVSSLTSPVEDQQAAICEVNLNNELPMHTHPMYGHPVDVAGMIIDANVPLFTALPRASATPPHGFSFSPRSLPSPPAQVEDPSSLEETLRTEPPRLLYRRSGNTMKISERTGRNALSGFVVRDPGLMRRFANYIGIPTFGFHVLDTADPRSITAALDSFTPGRSWHLDRAGLPESTSFLGPKASLEEVWHASPRQGRWTLEELPAGPVVTALTRGSENVSTFLERGLTLTGDGRLSLTDLLASALAATPFRAHLRNPMDPARLALLAGRCPADVLGPEETLEIPALWGLGSGARPVPIEARHWPELESFAGQLNLLLNNPGISLVSFAPQHCGAGRLRWAFWRFRSEPDPLYLAAARMPASSAFNEPPALVGLQQDR